MRLNKSPHLNGSLKISCETVKARRYMATPHKLIESHTQMTTPLDKNIKTMDLCHYIEHCTNKYFRFKRGQNKKKHPYITNSHFNRLCLTLFRETKNNNNLCKDFSMFVFHGFYSIIDWKRSRIFFCHICSCLCYVGLFLEYIFLFRKRINSS